MKAERFLQKKKNGELFGPVYQRHTVFMRVQQRPFYKGIVAKYCMRTLAPHYQKAARNSAQVPDLL